MTILPTIIRRPLRGLTLSFVFRSLDWIVFRLRMEHDVPSTSESLAMEGKSDNLSCPSTLWRFPGASVRRGHRPTSDRRECPFRPRCPGPARRSRRRFLWWPDGGRWWCTSCPAWLCPGPPARPARRKCRINATVCFSGKRRKRATTTAEMKT